MQTPTEMWNKRWSEDPAKYTSKPELEFELLSKGLGNHNVDSLLEIGAGVHNFSYLDLLVDSYVVDVDISSVALKKAKTVYNRPPLEGTYKKLTYDLVMASAVSLPFRKGVFGQAASCETVLHLGREYYDSIAEMARCAPRVAFTAVKFNPAEISKHPYEKLKYGTLFELDGMESFLSMDEENARSLLKELGFVDENIKIWAEPYLVNDRTVPEIDSRIYVNAKRVKASGGT